MTDTTLLRTTFDQFDTDGSGYIEIGELEALLERLGLDARADDEVMVAMAKLSPKEAHRISYEELELWWHEHGADAVHAEPETEESDANDPQPENLQAAGDLPTNRQLRTVFDRFDADSSGDIDLKELARFLEAAGFEPDDAQLESMFAAFDQDGNGRLTWDEFVRWWDENMQSASSA